eukprot:159701-Chlamydomonas_euryale.AAC.2
MPGGCLQGRRGAVTLSCVTAPLRPCSGHRWCPLTSSPSPWSFCPWLPGAICHDCTSMRSPSPDDGCVGC